MSRPDEGGAGSHDFDQAWDHPQAFAIIKSGITKIFQERDDFNPENPYDQLITTLTVTGMIYSAYQLKKKIEVRYSWELLDDENMITHSCFGTIDKVDITINAEQMGFLMNIGDDDFGAFAYSDIYWVCSA